MCQDGQSENMGSDLLVVLQQFDVLPLHDFEQRPASDRAGEFDKTNSKMDRCTGQDEHIVEVAGMPKPFVSCRLLQVLCLAQSLLLNLACSLFRTGLMTPMISKHAKEWTASTLAATGCYTDTHHPGTALEDITDIAVQAQWPSGIFWLTGVRP